MVLGYLCLKSFSFFYTSLHGYTPIQGCAKVIQSHRKCFVTCILSFQICYIHAHSCTSPTIYHNQRTCHTHISRHTYTFTRINLLLLQQYNWNSLIIHVRHGINAYPNERRNHKQHYKPKHFCGQTYFLSITGHF